MKTNEAEHQSHPEGIVQIDRQRLDKECVRLPGDYLFYAHAAAEAKCDVDEAKAALEVAEAELAKRIRKNPKEFGLDEDVKITEVLLRHTTILHPDYKKALTALNKAKHEAEMQQAVVWALEHKKKSLTLLVELFGLGYFGDVKVTEVGRRAVEQYKEKRRRDED